MSEQVTQADIEIDIREANQRLAFGEKVLRLMQDADFQEVIVQHYIGDTTHEAIMARVDPAKQAPEEVTMALKALDGVGMLQSWLHNQVAAGRAADQALREAQAVKEEMMEEGEE